MPLLTLENAYLAYGDTVLLDHVGFNMEQGEHIALIGRNGSGKSTLLRAIAGRAQLDEARLWLTPHACVAYVPQEPDFSLDRTVFQAVSEGLGPVATLLTEYHAVSQLAEQTEATLARLAALQHDLDANNAWQWHHRVDQVLTQLGLEPDAPVAALSGGGIKRVALARALVLDPDLLLLDEPTNHLDVDSIAWLESQIAGFKGGAIVITHDRAFLDTVANRVLELDRGALRAFPGSFADYQRRKAEQLQAESKQVSEFDKFLAQEEVWIRKGVEARRTRDAGRVKRLEMLRKQRAQRRESMGRVDFQLDAGESSGNLVAELIEVSKRFSGKTVVERFSARIMRGDRVGFIGANGSGKTTLLKLILGELEPDEGGIKRGTRQSIAYFDQFRAQLDPEAALIDVISPGADFVEIGGVRKHVIGYLGDFLFSPSRARSPVKALSGGERNRLLLARLFAQPANIVVLDEPTNDLDIETLELLEALLQDYDGTVLLISHDRRFLDNIVTQVVANEGPGQWRVYAGGYVDWQQQRTRLNQDRSATAYAPAARKEAASSKSASRMSFKDKRELEQALSDIAALECEQRDLQALLADPSFYRDGADKAAATQKRLAAIDEELQVLFERWESLEAKNG